MVLQNGWQLLVSVTPIGHKYSFTASKNSLTLILQEKQMRSNEENTHLRK